MQKIKAFIKVVYDNNIIPEFYTAELPNFREYEPDYTEENRKTLSAFYSQLADATATVTFDFEIPPSVKSLEIRRKQEAGGKIFFQVWHGDEIKDTFYAGIIQDPMNVTNQYNAKMLAKELYERIKQNALTTTETVLCEMI